MSDQIIDQLRPTLKSLNTRIKKLGRTLDRLDVLAYRYQQLSAVYKQLSELMDHLDSVAFEIRQEFDQVEGVCDECLSKIRLTFP